MQDKTASVHSVQACKIGQPLKSNSVRTTLHCNWQADLRWSWWQQDMSRELRSPVRDDNMTLCTQQAHLGWQQPLEGNTLTPACSRLTCSGGSCRKSTACSCIAGT